MTDTDREQDPNLPEQPDLELSVIIPARNEERSLPACLASLLIQSEPGFLLGQQWELIIVNDDSTDDTRSINQIANGSQFNGISLFSGAATTFQVGATNTANDQLSVTINKADTTTLAINGTALTT